MKNLFLATLFSLSLLLAEENAPLPIGTRPTPSEIIEEQERAWHEREEKASKVPQIAKAFFNYAPTHTGSYHHPIMISPVGDSVEFEDGSQWSVNPSDRYKTYNWYTTDTLRITPNHTWFTTTFKYRITNMTTNESIEVALARRPLYNGLSTYWITAIDYLSQQLYLNDGSMWSLSNFHYMTFKDWIINDTVIIGHNDGFFANSWGNILINCETSSHIEARCIK